jgi:UDP-N-acetylmuramate--alanine ligase
MLNLPRNQRIHFIGIGGSGMAGIAEVLHNLKFIVSGSDVNDNKATQHLKKIGIDVSIGHEALNIKNAQIIVVSTAITQDNIEVMSAKQNRIPIISRAEMLAELMRFRYGIAISGTHGKTTTTSLIAHILNVADLDPTFIIGGVLKTTQSNAKLGKSQYLIAEADESDGSFLNLQPLLSVITNIDLDHMETYDGDVKKLENAFLQFITNLPFYGLCVLCCDDKGVENILSRVARPFICYGFSKNADIRAIGISRTQTQTTFTLLDNIRNQKHAIELNLIGNHNVLNTLGAITVALELEIDITDIQKALMNFKGVARRLDDYGDIEFANKKIRLFDDYGHHPNELKVVFESLKQSFLNKRLVVIFQPHRYSRTRDLFNEFVEVLTTPDALLLLDIFPAGEKPLADISSEALAKNINNVIVTNLDNVINKLSNIVQDDDVVLCVGAGSIGTLVSQISCA